MAILYLILILAAIYPLSLFWDYRTLRDQATGDYKSQYTSDSLAMFAPFAALYYHEFFWQALLYYFVPLYFYFVALAWLVKRKVENFPPFDMTRVMGSGVFILVIIIYYLFFHQGSLAEEVQVQTQMPEITTPMHWLIWWPFAAIILAGLSTVLIIRILRAEKVLFISALVFLVLPFFSHHPLLAMLLAIVVFFNVCFAVAKTAGDGGGAYAAFFYFYMLGQMAALMVYAFLF